MCPKCMSLRISILATGERNKLYECKRCRIIFVLTKEGKLGTIYKILKKQTMNDFLQALTMK